MGVLESLTGITGYDARIEKDTYGGITVVTQFLEFRSGIELKNESFHSSSSDIAVKSLKEDIFRDGITGLIVTSCSIDLMLTGIGILNHANYDINHTNTLLFGLLSLRLGVGFINKAIAYSQTIKEVKENV